MDDMTTTSTARAVPTWYWVVAALAVLWEGMGCAVYLMQTMTPEAEREAGYAAMASWQWGVFAVAVWTGLIGAVGLLLRKSWATLFLLLSLLAAAFQYGYAAIQGSLTPTDTPMAAAIIIVGGGVLLFAHIARRRGWLS